MSITQTVEIPADHRLTIDVPREIPAGPADITFSARDSKERRIPVISWLLNRRRERQYKALMRFSGCLANSPAFQGDPVEIIRKERDAWDVWQDIDETKNSF